MPNVLDISVRKSIIDEILSRENMERKEESRRRFDVFKKRQAQQILEKLVKEFSQKTVSQMRTITSINLVPRIVGEEASIYKNEPERTFTLEGGKELSENEQSQIDNLYKFGKVNVKNKKSNKYFKLQNQCSIQVIPRDGVIDSRVLQPHHFDVVPDDIDPEKAYAYILSAYDRSQLEVSGYKSLSNENKWSDTINQKIADTDDYRKNLMRFVWWTAEYNFITDGYGKFVDAFGNKYEQVNMSTDVNPIGELPFIDIASDKDFEFWDRAGNDTVDFALDFGVLLSDTADINRMQGHSQAIIYSEAPPESMQIGPHKVLHIPQDPNKEIQARFEFANPNADMQASLELLETYLRLFLSSKGLDPKTISGKIDSSRFASGVDRLLAMIEKFEASQDDIDLYRWVEQKQFKLMVKWSNLFQSVTSPNGRVQPLREELRLATLPEDIVLTTVFKKPEVVQTKSEKEDSAIKQLDAGLMSRSEAISDIRGITQDEAKEKVKEIDQESLAMPVMPVASNDVSPEEEM